MGILGNTDEIVDKWLAKTLPGLHHIGDSPQYMRKQTTRTLETELSAATLPSPDGSLVGEIFDEIERKWNDCKPLSPNPSPENWTLRKCLRDDADNTSPEVTLERNIVRIANSWFNQTPTAASLLSAGSDKHRKIDLARKEKDAENNNVLSLYELKCSSDTPLVAAIQILCYGLLYLFSKLHAHEIGHSEDEKPMLFKAASVHLRTLAPLQYYREYAGDRAHLLFTGWIEASFNSGLKTLLQNRKSIPMDFSFWTFQEGFRWQCGDDDDAELEKALNGICPLENLLPGHVWVSGGFIKLRRAEAKSRQLLLEMIKHETVRRWADRNWRLDNEGFVAAEFARWLYHIALSHPEIRDWFNAELCSDTHDVSFDAFDRCLGTEEREPQRKELNNTQLKELLPLKNSKGWPETDG